jgi:thiol:disulfide interchange protein DsbA
MTTRQLLMLILMALLVTGCGAESEAPEQSAAPAPTADAAPETAPATAPPAEPQEKVQDKPDTQVVKGDPGDAPAVLAAPDATAPATPPSFKYSAGKHYSQLTSAQGTSSAPGGIEVTEVFWYGCPHCFSFDPIIGKWEGEQPADVRFVRLPVMWNPTNEIHARMFYTAEALDKLDPMHEAIFSAMHRDGKMLTKEDEIREFFEKYGVTGEEFDATFRSFAVESKLKRAKDLTARYRVRSVPVVVVDGKYIVDGPEVKSYADMLAVTDELVAKERAQR